MEETPAVQWSPFHPPGTVIQASDRQYRVQPNGAWRRLPKYAEVKGILVDEYKPRKWCRDGVNWDGSRCWCVDCLAERKK